jgi:hypothetical protein
MTDLVAVPHGRAPIGHCRLVLAGTGCDCENGQRPTKFHEALWAHSRACTIATSRFAAKPTHDATEPRAIWATMGMRRRRLVPVVAPRRHDM